MVTSPHVQGTHWRCHLDQDDLQAVTAFHPQVRRAEGSPGFFGVARTAATTRLSAAWHPCNVSYMTKPVFIHADLLDYLCLDSQAQLLQLIRKLIAINQVYRGSPISGRLSYCISRESARCDQQTLISSTNHCTSKVSHLACRDSSLIAFTLEYDVETQQTTDPNDASPIDTTIPRTTGNLDLHKSRLSKKPLGKTLKSIGSDFFCQHMMELGTP